MTLEQQVFDLEVRVRNLEAAIEAMPHTTSAGRTKDEYNFGYVAETDLPHNKDIEEEPDPRIETKRFKPSQKKKGEEKVVPIGLAQAEEMIHSLIDFDVKELYGELKKLNGQATGSDKEDYSFSDTAECLYDYVFETEKSHKGTMITMMNIVFKEQQARELKQLR